MKGMTAGFAVSQGTPWVDLSQVDLAGVSGLIPADLQRALRVVPLSPAGRTLCVAVAPDWSAQAALEAALGRPVVVVHADPDQVNAAAARA
jgi:hypothetical protein